MAKQISYVGKKLARQKLAALVDEKLMGELGFHLPQLVEQAGLACALAAVQVFPKPGPTLVLVGSGNNGADGLVCARILRLFGYHPTVIYPRASSSSFMQSLIAQCGSFSIPVEQHLPNPIPPEFSYVVDGFFGFSFKPPVRAPFDDILEKIINSKLPVLSIDIPSGWDVEKGPPPSGLVLQPTALISLSVPKMGVSSFQGRHFLGGRFLPESLLNQLNITIPEYKGADLIVELEQTPK